MTQTGSGYGDPEETLRTDSLAGGSPGGTQWRPGDILLKHYRVEGVVGRGGMGKVYHVVREIGRTESFAVKTLLKTNLPGSQGHRAFLQELRTWIDLPEYPHIVACRFFRTIQGKLSIFADYVSGGSLQSWIEARRLVAVPAILDVAIQMAWGLQAAHDHGVIHQDVKPANVMMTDDGQAKITDFGLARAIDRGGVSSARFDADPSTSPLVSSSGMTLAYCSPEQASGLKVGTATDVWSWGVSIMQMFTGTLSWRFGNMAAQILESVRSRPPVSPFPRIPDPVAAVLSRCFQENPKDRWRRIEEAAEMLRTEYEAITGETYSRSRPETPPHRKGLHHPWKAIVLRSNPLPNPADTFRAALAWAGQPVEQADEWATLQRGTSNSRALVDLEIFEAVEALLDRELNAGRKNPPMTPWQLHRNIGQLKESMDDIPGALEEYQRGLDALDRAGRHTLTHDDEMEYFHLLNDMGSACMHLRETDRAHEIYSEAIARATPLIHSDEIRWTLSVIYLNRGALYAQSGRLQDAGEMFDAAIRIRETFPLNKKNSPARLASAYMNRANIDVHMAHLESAAALYDKAIELYRLELQTDPSSTLVAYLALTYTNKCVAFWKMKRFEECLELLNTAIKDLEDLIFTNGFMEHREKLALLFGNKSALMLSMKRVAEARAVGERAVELWEKLVLGEGRTDYLPDLAEIYYKQSAILRQNGDIPGALELLEKAIDLIHRLRTDHPSPKLDCDDARNRLAKARLLRHLGRLEDAGNYARDTRERIETLLSDPANRNNGWMACLADLEIAFDHMAFGRKDQAVQLAQRALAELGGLPDNENEEYSASIQAAREIVNNASTAGGEQTGQI